MAQPDFSEAVMALAVVLPLAMGMGWGERSWRKEQQGIEERRPQVHLAGGVVANNE